MVILEVLVGTEAFIDADTFLNVQSLVKAAKEYIDPTMRALFYFLLLERPSVDLVKNVTTILDTCPMCTIETT